ncbi:MAG: hypothetical protein ABEI31_02795 [Halodesulfurarchaeum sp.]
MSAVRAVPVRGIARLQRRRSGRVAAIAGGVTLLATALVASVRLLLNVPVAVPVGPVYPLATVLASAFPAFALVGLAVTIDDEILTAVFPFAGVFGLLSIVATPASLPAVIAIAAGTVAVAWRGLEDVSTADQIAEGVVTVILTVGALIALAGGVGISPVLTGKLGSTLTLLGVAGTPVFVDWDWGSIAVGIGAAVAVMAIGLGAPFVTGATALVVGSIVGASLPLVAAGMLGATSTIAGGIRSGRARPALAGAILVTAGVPSATPRGLAFLVALTLLVYTHD